MICINRVTLILMLAFTAPWCYGQVVNPASRSKSPAPSTNQFLNTEALREFPESINSRKAEKDRLPRTAFGLPLLESPLPTSQEQETDLPFIRAAPFSSPRDMQTAASANRESSLPARAKDEPDTDLDSATDWDSGAVQALFNYRLTETERRQTDFSEIDTVNFQIDNTDTFDMPLNAPVMQSSAAYGASGVNSVAQFNVGVDLYGAPDFKNGLLIYGQNVAMKIGGYVKADFIYDFDPINSTDSFDTTKIPVDALPRTNSRFHARQSRLSFDTRWKGGGEVVKI